jgi:uncharacterized protein (TIGR02171 family)
MQQTLRGNNGGIQAWLALFCLTFFHCTFNDDGNDKNHSLAPFSGMIVIQAKGKSFVQGSSSPFASTPEKPSITNSFTYDFQMDAHEVTQGWFQNLMDRDPIFKNTINGRGDNYPVYNVSWFDAVLFCNARSKVHHLDTVYAYTRLEQSLGASVYNLVGLSINLASNGFRLPTEAEWEYVADAGRTTDYPWGELADSALAKEFAWSLGNAKGTTHPVGALKPNAFGVYDMCGNVMEWVNDWKGLYPEIGTEDFTGARDPAAEFTAPVKGGAFNFGLRELRPASRSATYATIRSATSEYVGFRCVSGAITNPHFSGSDGKWTTTDAVRLEIPRIQNLVGGRSAKLVFVNANQSLRHLAYIDYQKVPARVQEFTDIQNVFYPVISPDGNWVAFGTAVEGSVSGSSLYIRKLGDSSTASQLIGPGFIPRWWVDPASRDTFLVYVNSAADNSQQQWNATATMLQKIQAGAPVGAPQALEGAGFHDGRSQDGRWLATGFKFLKLADAINHTVRTLFTAPENGKEAGDTSQACNVSIAPDSSGRTLMLDFGYEGTSTVTGSFYDIHQVAFLLDPGGRVLRWFKAPPVEKSWEDLEWSNQKEFAVSSAVDHADGRHHLYLLNMKDSITSLLASGTQLSTPGLWMDGPPMNISSGGLNLDSLGHYNDPENGDRQAVFSMRMALFWKRHASLELIFTGSSHVWSGVDPHQITKLNSLTMGYSGNGWLGQEEWTKNYALNHCPKLKVMVMEVFPGWLQYSGGGFTWTDLIAQTKGFQYDRSHDFWKTGLPVGFEDLVKFAPNSTLYAGDSLGFRFMGPGSWGGPPILEADTAWGLTRPEYLDNMEHITEMATLLSNRKIHLVLVNFPTNPAFNGTGAYGTYGPKNEVAHEVIKRLQALEQLSPYIHFYDAHQFCKHDYLDSDASDPGHLNSIGAAKLTKRLDDLIHTFIDN